MGSENFWRCKVGFDALLIADVTLEGTEPVKICRGLLNANLFQKDDLNEPKMNSGAVIGHVGDLSW